MDINTAQNNLNQLKNEPNFRLFKVNNDNSLQKLNFGGRVARFLLNVLTFGGQDRKIRDVFEESFLAAGIKFVNTPAANISLFNKNSFSNYLKTQDIQNIFNNAHSANVPVPDHGHDHGHDHDHGHVHDHGPAGAVLDTRPAGKEQEFIDPVKGLNMTIEEIMAIPGIVPNSQVKQAQIVDSKWDKLEFEYNGVQDHVSGFGGKQDAVFVPGQAPVVFDWGKPVPFNHDGSKGKAFLSLQHIKHYMFKQDQPVPQVVILTLGHGLGSKDADRINKPGELLIKQELVDQLKAEPGVKAVLVLKSQDVQQKVEELTKAGILYAAAVHTTC